MNLKFFKQVLQYAFSLAVAVGVLWYVLQDVAVEEMLETLPKLDFFWVGISIFLGFLGYLVRAFRWNLLLAPLAYRPGLINTYLALMVGYLANMVFPRAGELVRCGMLKRSNEVPVSNALGTVVTERVIDFLCLLLVVFITLLIEFDRLQAFLVDVFSEGERFTASSAMVYLLGGFLLVVLLLAWLVWWQRHDIRKHPLYQKVIAFARELLKGILSIQKLQKPAMFWVSTLFIWLTYYLMSYLIVFSLPQTADIELVAGLAILAMGGIGMAAPVQGGLGTYHLLVSGVLMVYGASKNDAVLLAFVLHTSQLILVIFTGVLSLIVSLIRNKKKSLNPLEHV